MDCRHYFVDEAGYQPLSKERARRLGRDCFLLGLCIIPECSTAICADNYIDSGEIFDGKKLLFSPELERIVH